MVSIRFFFVTAERPVMVRSCLLAYLCLLRFISSCLVACVPEIPQRGVSPSPAPVRTISWKHRDL